MKVSARERKLLIGLAALGGLALLRTLYSASSVPAAPDVAARAAVTAPRAKRGKAVEVPDQVTTLRLDALDREPHDLTYGRDPFRYAPPPPPPPPPPPTKAELERMRRDAEARRLAEEAAARERLIPKPPPVDITYLGSFGPESKRVAVFADESGQNLYNARTGDVLEGKFIVYRIGYESVDLKFVGFPDEPARRLAIGG